MSVPLGEVASLGGCAQRASTLCAADVLPHVPGAYVHFEGILRSLLKPFDAIVLLLFRGKRMQTSQRLRDMPIADMPIARGVAQWTTHLTPSPRTCWLMTPHITDVNEYASVWPKTESAFVLGGSSHHRSRYSQLSCGRRSERSDHGDYP